MKKILAMAKLTASLVPKLPPLPADAEYRKELQQEAALADTTGERNIGNNENNETPAGVSGAEPMPNSVSTNSNDDQTDTYNGDIILDVPK